MILSGVDVARKIYNSNSKAAANGCEEIEKQLFQKYGNDYVPVRIIKLHMPRISTIG
jgi:hypothetical protein